MMVVTLGQQYNVEEKSSTFILYTYINGHACRDTKQKQNKIIFSTYNKIGL